MRSNLKHYYLEDAKLAQLAWNEFRRAHRTGRVIAFVGSMATEGFGYGSWEELCTKYLEDAKLIVDALASDNRPSNVGQLSKDRAWALDMIAGLTKAQQEKFVSDITAMSLVDEVLDHERIRRWSVDGWALEGKSPSDPRASGLWPLDTARAPVEYLAERFAVNYRYIRKPDPAKPAEPLPAGLEPVADVPKLLFDGLDIRRFATTNYDFELERKTMLRDQPEIDAGGETSSPFLQLRKLREQIVAPGDAEVFSWDLGSGRIRRVLMHGKASESDLLNRERIDRLLEFSIGTDDADSHVMHLHGRACDAGSMIVTQRDYDALYRRNDLNRLPFEFAKRLMTGGNPMLFVGLGMGEEDVNRELREFISNKPYHRAAPAFLLWSAIPGAMTAEERRIKRLDILHRLGVLTIFDTDFDLLKDQQTLLDFAQAEKAADRKISRPVQLHALALSVQQLAGQLALPAREDHVGRFWRHTEPTIKRIFFGRGLRILWATQFDDRHDDIPPPAKELVRVARKARVTYVLGSSGCGKGYASNGLAQTLAKTAQCLLINGGYSFDTDSMLDGICRFLEAATGCRRGPTASRSEYFEELAKWSLWPRRVVHIVLNGAERFFSISGRPISAELDELMQADLPKIHWTIFGTERIASYAREKLNGEPLRFDALMPEGEAPVRQAGFPRIPFRQLDFIARQIELPRNDAGAPIAGAVRRDLATLSPGDWRALRQTMTDFDALSVARISGDADPLRQAFYCWALDDDVIATVLADHGVDRGKVKLAHSLLRVLAFFGLPVEHEVLAKVPALEDQAGELDPILKALIATGLILRLEGYGGYVTDQVTVRPRYALHRSLLTELRSRFGIPLTEAKLSTAFNMSLYVAQPVDGYIPEPDIHDELGDLIDKLLGAYIDDNPADTIDGLAAHYGRSVDETRAMLDRVATHCQACRREPLAAPVAAMRPDKELLRIHRLCLSEGVQRLRAALAVIRGYYSTTGILTLDNGDRLVREDRDGILLEHAERLDRLVDAYAKTSSAREALRDELGSDGSELFDSIYRPGEPFYGDELVWLHNEIGVVRLAMGDLHEARAALLRAMNVNRQWVEFRDRAHNWRRIRLNQLTVEIEMGDIGLTRRIAHEIITVSGRRARRLQEDQLAVAIATGHLGWCSHLQGEYDRAEGEYKAAIDGLRDLAEIRAQAYFERMRINVLNRSTLRANPGAKRGEIEKALDLAQSTRQMDLVYRLQIALAYALFFDSDRAKRDRNRANRILEEALQYAIQTDVHRVRCEASMAIARFRNHTGDFEGALRFASDALMVATRYGMELRKITLRTDIAGIMAARGHPVTAQKLALTAVSAASRQRFQTAIDRAESVLLRIPRLSAAIGHSDLSGRRTF